jgi:branched-subunit amino acid aminotransferase/4-amino-4-deoxychorismate lyase
VAGVVETVLVEEGRIRLVDRHLARLARSGVPAALVDAAAAAFAGAAAAGGGPIVLRVDVDGCRVRADPRAPRSRAPAHLRTVVGYDPGDRTRELKRSDRRWAEAAEAAAGGAEPLLVSSAGEVGETSRANVFAIAADGAVVTPPACGLLPGVTRAWAMEQTAAAERVLPLTELVAGRAAFLTTAGRGIVRVAAIDGVALGDDDRIAELAAAWRAL